MSNQYDEPKSHKGAYRETRGEESAMYRYVVILIVLTLYICSVTLAQEAEKEAYRYCIDLVKEGSMIGMMSDIVSDPTDFIDTFGERYGSLNDAAFICWEFVEPYAQGAGEQAYDFGTVVVDRAGEAWVASKPHIIREGSEPAKFLERKLDQSGEILQEGWEIAREDVYPIVRDSVVPFISKHGKRAGKWIEKRFVR